MRSASSVIGTRIPEHSSTVERGRLAFFSRAIGENDPVYTDLKAAREAGHRDLPVPPTFVFCLDMDRPNPSKFYTDLGIDIRTILHGEQAFTYHTTAYAGDTLHFSTEVTDTYEKKRGALRFFVRTTEVTRDGEPIAQMRNTTVVRDPRAS
ncbi:MaoC family dehydratase N-terminal domain-containing protein [Rhodococcus sp. ARC_M6]|uniref:MaoC family dehydratase N-terminal domain-containing protein n=1 Tax=Rhodococcus sp. ARC_M6 TaxID=2928852 RepID=UPI001FB229EB|nr:MaoC family dehydratase N-terminal domain-containing protein [Rhodococcus sp. ARC_M6]MCJ0907495.1 MaoC family dehydratase N-terminal domain-containing protein [Rhodococcus sp. ARC_M6]